VRSDSRPVYVDVRVGVNVSVLISVSLTVVVGPVLVLPFSEVRDAREWKELLSPQSQLKRKWHRNHYPNWDDAKIVRTALSKEGGWVGKEALT
jgi:hypothetical protein